MSAPYKIVNNEEQMHFEIHEGNEIAFLEYRFYEKYIAFMHTKVPESMEGKGAASALAAYAFSYAKENKNPVIVYCPLVKEYMKKHPEVLQQVNKEF